MKKKKKKIMSEESSGGVGFIGLLQLLFIALKLTGYITWNWFYVLLPFESVIAVFLFMTLVCLPVWIENWIDDYKERRKEKKWQEQEEQDIVDEMNNNEEEKEEDYE